MTSSNKMPSRLWRDITLATAPIVLTVLLGLEGWVLLGTARGEFRGLTIDDERRIVDEAQTYADKQTAAIRQDLNRIQQDLARINETQTKILLALQKK